jgi:4-hydroxybenzoate polyprenyltransferase
VPDHDADRLAGKRTLAVRTGVAVAYLIAAICTVLAAATAILLAHTAAAGQVFAGIEYAVLPHAAGCWSCSPGTPRRMPARAGSTA